MVLFLAQQPSVAEQIRRFTVSATARRSEFGVTDVGSLAGRVLLWLFGSTLLPAAQFKCSMSVSS